MGKVDEKPIDIQLETKQHQIYRGILTFPLIKVISAKAYQSTTNWIQALKTLKILKHSLGD